MFSYQYRFIDTYYLINYAVILSYLFVRKVYSKEAEVLLTAKTSWFGLTRELEIFVLMGLIQLKNLRRRISIDNVIQSAVLGLKTVVLVLVFQIDRKLAIIYGVIYLLIFLCLTPPSYNGPSKVLDYSEMTFKSLVLDDLTTTKYIVMFDTTWASGIEYVKAMFASISNKFTSNSVFFLHVDLTYCPELAKELKINLSGYAGEIPVFMCFQKGKEVSRVPEYSEKPKVAQYKWTEDILLQAFGLETMKEKKTK